MCGIIGIFNRENASADAIKALGVMRSRGTDQAGAAVRDGIFYASSPEELRIPSTKRILGHLLHSLVEFVPEPIKREGFLAANCEIYNWKELDSEYGFHAKNDADLALGLIERKGIAAIEEFDGVYALAHWKGSTVTLVRDILGVKPLWYSRTGGLCFASEKKALLAIGCKEVRELNPRTILEYDLETGSIRKTKRKFFTLGPTVPADPSEIRELLVEAVRKRIPEQKFGILFSGGLDSTVLATICKKLGKDFTCYTAAVSGMGAEDFGYSKKVAGALGFPLRARAASLEEARQLFAKVVPLIEDNNVVKAGVAATLFAACEFAKQDGVRVLFSGLGSEELFAGYDRHRKASDLNKECLSGLLKMYERDLYRDDVLTMNNSIELRLPFLDKKLAAKALTIPPEQKIQGARNKAILRDIARDLGIPAEFAERPKKAAQYGSRFDRALEKLSKKEGFSSKSAFLKQFYAPPNVKLAALWSGGKDSAFAASIMTLQNYEISCLVSLKSSNPASYMFHTPNISLASLHAEAMGIPLILHETAGEKEKELEDLEKALQEAKERFRIEGVVTGALFSNYQRDRIEAVCDKLDLKIFAPLWHMDQEKELRLLLDRGFSILFSSVAAQGLDASWLGRILTQKDIDGLAKIAKKHGLNVAGEGGETESLVLDCPLFKKKLEIVESEIIKESEHAAQFVVKKAKLVEKR